MSVASLVLSFFALLTTLILLVRFCKRPLAVFHRVFPNRIAIRFAPRLPGFAIVTSVGRKSGRLYRTPVNVFREPEGFLIALTSGKDSGWVKNVMAAEGCQLETRGVCYEVFKPVVVHDRARRRFPIFVRVILGLINANDFLQLSLRHTHTSILSGSKIHR